MGRCNQRLRAAPSARGCRVVRHNGVRHLVSVMSGVPNRRLLVTMLLLWGAAAVAYAALRLTYGERPAYVNVRWSTSIGDVERGRLERQVQANVA